MFGLGHYIYAGESVPHDTQEAQARITDAEAADIKKRLAATNSDVRRFCEVLNIDNIDNMPLILYAQAVQMIAKKEAQV